MISDYLELATIVQSSYDCPSMGGNVSVKNSESMRIKMSGTKMSDFKSCEIPLDSTSPVSKNGRASMEYKMHLRLKKYVLHYHPFYALPLLCQNLSDIEEQFNKLNLNVNFSVIEYSEPGDELAKKFSKKEIESEVILLQNHGIVIHSGDISIIRKLYFSIKDALTPRLNDLPILTPDDFISNDLEQVMHRLAVMKLAELSGYSTKGLTKQSIQDLLKNESEIFRKEGQQ